MHVLYEKSLDTGKHGTEGNFESFRRNFCQFRGLKILGIPFWPLCRREKHLELRNFVPNHSAEDENARNSFPNHFLEEKNTRNFVISFWIIPQKMKTLRIPFRTISQKIKTLGILIWPIKRKKPLILVWKASRTKKGMTLKKTFFRRTPEFRSELQNGLFRYTRNSAKGILFPRNSENLSESIPENCFWT